MDSATLAWKVGLDERLGGSFDSVGFTLGCPEGEIERLGGALPSKKGFEDILGVSVRSETGVINESSVGFVMMSLVGMNVDSIFGSGASCTFIIYVGIYVGSPKGPGAGCTFMSTGANTVGSA